MCTICYEESFDLIKGFECSHEICVECFDKWFYEKSLDITCPICRAEVASKIGKKDLLQVFYDNLFD